MLRASAGSARVGKRRGNVGNEGLGKKAKAKVVKQEDAGAAEGAEEASPSAGGKKRKLDDSELKEREKRTMFVGNVPVAWTEKRLRGFLRVACGTTYEGQLKPIWFRSLPLESRWNTSKELRKAGRIKQAYMEGAEAAKNAYVVLRGPEDVPTVVKLVNNLQADTGHILRADGVGESAVLKKFDRKRSVFLGSLPRRVTEDDIRWVLWPAGQVDAVRIVRNKITQECQGFAFARFQERWSVKEALKLWPKIHGKEIRITKVEDSSAEDKPGKDQARPEDHPAAKRIVLKQQRRERQKAKKKKEWLANAKTSGLRPGKSKKVKKKLKQSNRKKAGR
ncbi:RBM34 [Symbiodinium natans]|uniref:RBM34 protein n=1 Tax=Symbiodinium natans TaxID=878477 RepID=A0A812MRU7_9DINO|nr:RBM34 [Symbiodinium natans]